MTVEAQEAFLRAFHDEHPGITAAAYAAGQGPDGRSSYDVLADLCAPLDRVLDLGCGDGFLLERCIRRRGVEPRHLCAVDLSPGELRAAGVRLPDVPRVLARAQALPFAPASFDLVLSHLAFTLMPGPDVIVGELVRVLRPGGRFAAIVGGGPCGDDAFAGFLDLARPYLAPAATPRDSATARPRVPRLGEPRARTDAGLAYLFSPATGFSPPAVTDLPIDLSGPPDAVLARLATAYELAPLPPTDLADLRHAFLSAAPHWRRPDGLTACTMLARLVVTARLPA